MSSKVKYIVSSHILFLHYLTHKFEPTIYKYSLMIKDKSTDDK